MADRPIIFSAPMVRALLDGRKTQTRRVLSPQPPLNTPKAFRIADQDEDGVLWMSNEGTHCAARLRYAVGDRLWVREAWRAQQHFDAQSPADICAEFQSEYGAASCPAFYEADEKCDGHSVDLWQQSPPGRLRASMHMPRCASRITLTVTDVRVQRLQEISEGDARAEGAGDYLHPESPHGWREAFAGLWDSLNADRGYGWEANPWVIALSFTVERRNIDEGDVQ